jgi:hypothetical protein
MEMGDKAAKKQRPSRGAPRRSSTTDIPPNIVEIDERIDVARENLRALVEQAAAYSGAADEERQSLSAHVNPPTTSALGFGVLSVQAREIVAV